MEAPVFSADRYIDALRAADLRVAAPSLLILALSTIALLIAMVTARRRMPYALTGLTAIFAAAITLAILPPKPAFHPGLEVTSIDVGQGDSTLLVTPPA